MVERNRRQDSFVRGEHPFAKTLCKALQQAWRVPGEVACPDTDELSVKGVREERTVVNCCLIVSRTQRVGRRNWTGRETGQELLSLKDNCCLHRGWCHTHRLEDQVTTSIMDLGLRTRSEATRTVTAHLGPLLRGNSTPIASRLLDLFLQKRRRHCGPKTDVQRAVEEAR
eukprot:CAMPEP_0205828160 /NCGR_PEP_ID=MMETSP0206-20130828/34247_1 /ASSEMBLY_ACC=CAM_ASM_000279 /TAXON_ID=36767 /ORGANISM="Euplotes focardii, Strain TN1" /LENGTH=169 /DNA_ID=CAMNT_0053129711 /DNA_START=359 /DNA_END=868 /DNA_ORIENTATION=+